MPGLDDVFNTERAAIEAAAKRARNGKPHKPRPIVEEPVISSEFPEVPVEPPDDAPGRFTQPNLNRRHGPHEAGIRNELERRAVFADLWTELRHEQPEPTIEALAELLKTISDAPILVMERDALIRLAAWAIAHASKTSAKMSPEPPPVRLSPDMFDLDDGGKRARL